MASPDLRVAVTFGAITTSWCPTCQLETLATARFYITNAATLSVLASGERSWCEGCTPASSLESP